MKDNVYFYVQYNSTGSSSRGIQSGGVVLSIDDLCDEKYVRKLLMCGRSTLMYQVGRDMLRNLKVLRLEDFEKIFHDHINGIKHLLGFSELEPPFRKEILVKYGHTSYSEVKKTTTTYNKGDIITGTDGMQYLYLGNIKTMEMFIDGEKKKEYSGHLYMPVTPALLKFNTREWEINEILEFLKHATHNFDKFKRHFLKTKKKHWKAR